MKKQVWLARNKDKNAYYEIWTGPKPKMNESVKTWLSYGGGTYFLKYMCPKHFHQFCNIRLKKGQCVPVKLTHLKHGFKFEVML